MRILSVRSYAWALALIITPALSGMSCASRREATHRTYASSYASTSHQTTMRQTYAHRPAETLTLSLPLLSLRDSLPNGAAYVKRSGAVSISARPTKAPNGTTALDITASCDSLLLVITELEDRLTEAQQRDSTTTEATLAISKTAGPRISHLLVFFVIGIALGWWGKEKIKQHITQ